MSPTPHSRLNHSSLPATSHHTQAVPHLQARCPLRMVVPSTRVPPVPFSPATQHVPAPVQDCAPSTDSLEAVITLSVIDSQLLTANSIAFCDELQGHLATLLCVCKDDVHVYEPEPIMYGVTICPNVHVRALYNRGTVPKTCLRNSNSKVATWFANSMMVLQHIMALQPTFTGNWGIRTAISNRAEPASILPYNSELQTCA